MIIYLRSYRLLITPNFIPKINYPSKESIRQIQEQENNFSKETLLD